MEPAKSGATGMKPRIWWRVTAASPADARQPQFSQSGAPPNWHGVIVVVKSAEIVVVVCAKTHSSGERGGSAYASISRRVRSPPR